MNSPIFTPTRRLLLQGMGAFLPARSLRASAGARDGLPEILARIKPPVFPGRDFDIRKFGAAGDGVRDDTGALRKAVEACRRAGGGRVVAPPGVYATGPVHLRSNVNLHVAAGATLRFHRDPARYLPLVLSRWGGVECMNYSPFLYCFEQENVAVTGAGTLDGAADCEHWWPWKGRTNCGWKKGDPHEQKARNALFAMAERDEPVEKRVFGEGGCLRPNFIQPYRSRNILIEGVTIVNSPMWEIHPVLCRNVTVRNVTVKSHGPNNDGCDPESCRDVLIEGCVFDTGDDCIALKSGRNREGRRINVPCENIVVRRCTMKDGHGGVTIGSEISGGCRGVWVEDCAMDSPKLDRVLRIKTNSFRGGAIHGIYCRNLTVGTVAGAAIDIDFHYEEGRGGAFLPSVGEIEIANLKCRKSQRVLSLRGFKEAPIRNVTLEDCSFENSARPDRVEFVEGLRLVRVTVNGAERRS